jgi:hypothetical protein
MEQDWHLTSVLCLGPICLDGVKIDIVERHTRALIHEIVPEWGLNHLDVLHKDILGLVYRPRDGSGGAGRIPRVSRAVESSTSVDMDP